MSAENSPNNQDAPSGAGGVGSWALLALYGAAAFVAAVLSWTLFELFAAPSDPATTGPRAEFALTDHTGRDVDQSVFEGQLNLVYFGYTQCPDFCPTELANMAEAQRVLEARGVDTQIFFITVDPARDTVDALAAYVPVFSDDALGLTGDPDQLASAARPYGVIARAQEPREDGWYAVDHTLFVYALSDTGAFITQFGPNTDPAAIADRLAPQS